MPVDKSAIGRTGEPVTMHVERGKIQEFARAIKDDDPLYYDEAHATREAGGIMPPVTLAWGREAGGGRARGDQPKGRDPHQRHLRRGAALARIQRRMKLGLSLGPSGAHLYLPVARVHLAGCR
jgi:hypothetical protein